VVLAAALGIAALVAVPTAGAATPSIGPHPHVYAGGGVIAYGDAQILNKAPADKFSSLIVAQAVDPSTAAQGYWLASADGGVFAYGSAGFFGSLGSLALQGPIVGMAATPDGGGYWLVALDGGIFAFGDAGFYGSMGGTPLNQPIVGMAATPDGLGYWLVASDGGIFAFGDATFDGSMGSVPLVSSVTGMAATPDGKGYWMVAGDGGLFAFGDAGFFGSEGGQTLNDPVVGMAASPDGKGYLLVATDGGIFGFGSFRYYGSLGAGIGGDAADVPPVAGITLTSDGQGYWLLEPDGWSYRFSSPGASPPTAQAASIVAIANAQVAADPDPGNFCNPYGPCEEWCALFATWVWQQAGVPIPSYAFTGDIYDWATGTTGVLPPGGTPQPGDAVLYGTGPATTDSSVHTGLVVQRWPDGAIITIEGDAGPAPTGSLAVVINGPYLPLQSAEYNGVPVYAFAQA
jgi:hypothetical protein